MTDSDNLLAVHVLALVGRNQPVAIVVANFSFRQNVSLFRNLHIMTSLRLMLKKRPGPLIEEIRY